MSLTVGTGPFGHHPTGRFDFDPPKSVTFVEVHPFVTVAWGGVDAWLEEDEEIVVHPHDPYHRIDVVDTSRRVVVRVTGERVADTMGARILFETALPPRYYLPREERPEVELELDGVVVERPHTPWADPAWSTRA